MTSRPDSANRLRQELVEAKEKLATDRAAVHRQHDLGMSGFNVSRKLTAMADAAIISLSESALADFPKTVSDTLRERCTLVAHGGYGRRQMAPYSDIDLMLLHQGRVDKHVERYARRLTQDVFDIGLQLGQSLRTVEEAIRLARHDAVITTSLIESRPLTGSQEVFTEFRGRFEKMVQRRKAAACAEFVAARREERNKFGETVFLLEPNIKRSPGALRDMHLLRWLWFANAGDSDLDRLQLRGVISKFDHRRLVNAREFLMRVRNELHFHAGKERDTLNRDEQVRIAEKLGFFGGGGMLPVEKFMRDYFRHAGHVGFLVNRLTLLSTPTTTVDRVLSTVFGRTIEQDFQIGVREVGVTTTGRAKLERYLEQAWQLLDLARLNNLRLAQDAAYLIYRSAPNYSNVISRPLRDRFLEILDKPLNLGSMLRQAHELGILEKILPDYTRARCLLQFNQYHKYTVDEHSIRAVEEVACLAKADSHLAHTYQSFTPKWLLHLGLLIHDLGKGLEEDHSIVGERIAEQTAERLSLSDTDRDDLMFVVREHLNMNRIAFRRDISDPATIEAMVTLVGNKRRLTLLYLLTCGDMAAVAPGAMNKWKEDMLGRLYARTLEALEPRPQTVQQNRHAMRNATWQALSAKQRESSWFKQQYQSLPDAYLQHHSPQHIADTLGKLHELADGQAAAWGHYDAQRGAVELVAGVSQGSGRGVFSSMAGALSAAGMQIVQADTTTLADESLLLQFVAEDTRSTGTVPAGRVAELTDKMVASLHSDQPPKFPRVWGADSARTDAELTEQPNEVRLDATLTNDWLIVEVFAVDRLGLLYLLARALHELGLTISFAKIGTSGDRVVDVFYVSERDRSKPTSRARLAEIRERLEATIEAPLT